MNVRTLLCSARHLAVLLVIAAQTFAAEPAIPGTLPLPDERVIIPELRGVITVADPADANLDVPAGFSGLDTSRTPLLAGPEASQLFGLFLGKPVSFGSLDRLCLAVRVWLGTAGHSFVSVYAPPQDVTAGVVRLVVENARLDGELKIEGARYFSEASYRRAVPLAPGAEIDAAAVQAGVDALNRSGYRQVVVVAEPGTASGTTRLVLRTRERRPWGITVGYSNAGTAVTGEDRVSAGLTWADAFGRGDVLGYSLSVDPEIEHSISHSANYMTTFRSGRSLLVYGSWSEIESELPPPLTQEGLSWQVGTRFNVPLRSPREGWAQNLAFTADLKAGDNTLEFAAMPITDNLTHVVQFGAAWALNFPALGGANALSVSGFVSPGGLSSRNHGRYFEIARPGAKARYGYAKVSLAHQRPLAGGFSWLTAMDAQMATGALLGTEQLNGSGNAGVRGYRESMAYGDSGVLVNNELHAPPIRFLRRGAQADLFGFFDFASLRNRGARGTSLQGAGLGLNLQWRRNFSLRAAYGWQLRDLEGRVNEPGYGHIATNVSW